VPIHKVDYFVIPASALNQVRFRAEAGIQNRLKSLDSHLHACALKRYGAQARE
jgi:hypothetical protein